MATEIVEGTTAPLTFQLLEAGEPLDLSGLTVTLSLKDRTGTIVSTAGMVTVTNAIDGEVTFTPANAGVLVAANGPYFARWTLTTSGGAVSYCPTELQDKWTILAA